MRAPCGDANADPVIVGEVGATPVVVTALVPLTRTRDDGSIVDVLAWAVDGELLVHPQRLAAWNAAVAAGRLQ